MERLYVRPNVWNYLPEDVRSSETIHVCKRKVKTLFFSGLSYSVIVPSIFFLIVDQEGFRLAYFIYTGTVQVN